MNSKVKKELEAVMKKDIARANIDIEKLKTTNPEQYPTAKANLDALTVDAFIENILKGYLLQRKKAEDAEKLRKYGESLQ